ncbi:iduronate 2-sulfatase [Maribacter vaceletii]|uniref:Iduronate 2-sulfatase n=1 Tax=Maribacter vaceletii TaxID=1206816 RepID=A0A495E602_9FLAO|nr:sulfatase [Maribacter vaceletii]RKR12141.1 iduronate 2-sulfatase [Maribacter vaceletii]
MQNRIILSSILMLGFTILLNGQISKKKNILLICVDDLRPELGSFGASYIKSPNIDKLVNEGRAFQNHYVNAPSCGPSRYTLLTGIYGPPKNDALFLRSKKIKKEPNVMHPSMPEWFRQNGYTTVSVGKVSHHPGGRGGKDWNDNNVIEMPNAWDKHIMPVTEWQHPRGTMHGLANGEIRIKAGDMDVFQTVEGPDTIYPDGHITNEAIKQLESLTSNNEKPFFLAVGIIKPHLPFGAPKKYFNLYADVKLPDISSQEKPKGISTWHESGEFMKYNRWGKNPNEDKEFAIEVRKHYAACVSYADAQVGRILSKLKETGADKNTIIVLWGDHGWNLGEHAIWGKHNLFEEGLHSPLIISYPGIKNKGKSNFGIVETVDVFPTLCDLTTIETPSFVKGKSLKPQLKKYNKKGHIAVSYNTKANTIRTGKYRLIAHKNRNFELYNHYKDPYEINNLAKTQPKTVMKLKKILDNRL